MRKHSLYKEASAALDRILSDIPDGSAILIAVAHDLDVDAISVPSAIAVKRGIVYTLHAKLFMDEAVT